MNLLLIAIGGAVGSVCRYLLSSAVLRAAGTLFPAGTFAVNAVGCLVFGVVAGATYERLTLSGRRELVDWIEQAITPVERRSRARQAAAMIRGA